MTCTEEAPVCSRKAGVRGLSSSERDAPAPTPKADNPGDQIRLAAQETTTSGDYVVKSGDTLGRIASVNNVTGGWKALVDKNPALKTNPDALKVGQRLSL